jgi:hypothetical protein
MMPELSSDGSPVALGSTGTHAARVKPMIPSLGATPLTKASGETQLREGIKAVNATSDILLMYSFPWCSSISLPPILPSFFLLTRSSLSRSSKTWMEFGNILLSPAEGLFIESFSLFFSLLTYFSYNSPLPFALCYSLLTLIGDLNALERP